MARVVITDYEYPHIDLEREILGLAGHEVLDYQAKTEEALLDITRDADAVIIQYAPVTRRVIENLQRCQALVKYAIGIDNIDVAAATERKIHVCNVPDYGLDEVSNHAIAMLLSLARKLPQADRALKAGTWGTEPFRPLWRLAGKTLGLVGFGALGRLVAKKMAGFGLTIIASDPMMDHAVAASLGVEPVDFDALCRRSDYISVHCPLTAGTRHLFNREAFAAMKDGVVFVNTARGGVVDQTALIAAITSGKIAGAGLDVYEQEPLPADSPLLTFDTVITTGHVAWYSEDSIRSLQQKAAQEVVNILAGNPPLHPCNSF
ncbi:MAG: C-terminal binding protein [Planctomycetes bacterium]|nr:C-terminal binding protein [Planctomycetota bacterium]